MNNYYIINMETLKLELHFDKNTYLGLDEKQKSEIKSNFLFSRHSGAWISRCKFPNLYRVEKLAQTLGLENGGKVNERLTFEEMKNKESERAERRADRYDYKSERAIERGESLQKPIHDMHGDIAFFTQPNINSSAGRAFTNRRNAMFSAWERGFDEFKKSEYYAEKAENARKTADKASGNVDKGFCMRRIADAEKTIKAQKRNLESYRAKLERIENGEVLKLYSGEILTAETVNGWIDNASTIVDMNIEKSIYYHELIDNMGGVNFSKENIKPGYIVKLHGWRGAAEVVSCGPKNITYKTGNGFTLTAAYAEIDEVLKAEESAPELHPFEVGESFNYKHWNGDKYEIKTATITKKTDKTITLETESGKKFNRKPCKTYGGQWAFSVNDTYGNTFYKTCNA